MDELDILSPREKDVVDMLMQGKSNKQIAYSLGISERTVEFHLKNIFEKMQVNSRVELILKLGKSTGKITGNQVKATVEIKGQSCNNGRQADTDDFSNLPPKETASADKKESAMKLELATILPPLVILMGIALIVGGMIAQKYGAVVIGIIAGGMAVFHWIQVLKKNK